MFRYQQPDKAIDLLDFGIGLCAFAAMFGLSVFTGGFSFFTPWIIWGGMLFFLAGFSRALPPEEAVWRRVVSINLCWLILVIPELLQGEWWGAALMLFGPLVPTTAGALARRVLTHTRPNS